MDITETTVLWCPMPPGIHPDWRQWERDTVAWMESFDLDGEQREQGRLHSIIAGELAGRTILTSVDPPGAQFSTDSLMWLFAFDDAYCDEGRYSHSPSTMAMLVAEMIRIAETGRTTSRSPLARALADLRQRLDTLTTPAPTARWVQAMKGYLGYQVWEAAYRSTNTMPTIDQYAVARIRNGSMEVCAMTLDIAEGYEVPADEIDRPDVRALMEMACSLVGWDNDIASYYKEHKRSGDKLNLVDVIAHERGVSPGEALPEAVAFRDAVLDLFLRLRDQVVAGPETMRYISGLSAWIRGNLDWSVNTARYRRPDRPTIAVTDDPDHVVGPFTPPPGIAWWWDQLRTTVAA
ncbi:terpene synthase family protein [Kibdelosporangium aridum]|uniref:terpene synthase family protein n=1 Tax=Kibdelosporangium aridum TaxID=2030 RepID=UPI000524525A